MSTKGQGHYFTFDTDLSYVDIFKQPLDSYWANNNQILYIRNFLRHLKWCENRYWIFICGKCKSKM